MNCTRSMNLIEIIVAVSIIGFSLLPIFFAFSASNQIVEVSIDDFESVNTFSEIQEQIRQYPFDKVLKLVGKGEQVIYKDGKLENQIGGSFGGIGKGLEIFISEPADSCKSITVKFHATNAPKQEDIKIIFLVFYHFKDKGKKNKRERKLVVPGVILQ